MVKLLHELVLCSTERRPEAPALVYKKQTLTYSNLAGKISAAAASFLSLGLGRSDRVAIYLEKRPETVAALLGACAAGGVFVPINPLLKAEQVVHILNDCNVRILVTSNERLATLTHALPQCHDLHTVVNVSGQAESPTLPTLNMVGWNHILEGSSVQSHRIIDSDMAAILYTSGSTGKPKGVVLSHRNIVAGAYSVSSYLGIGKEDRILAVLPLSFDYGLNQITTSFLNGACAVLMNYLLPRDIITEAEREAITGLAAVPPLWIQLAQLSWPKNITERLRYITNSGGKMPLPTLAALRKALPRTQVFLMYGLTEAFRSTYLHPAELDKRPESIGKAIPNSEILVLREDGSSCAPGEPGELVHRGVLVSLGYWNDRALTAERFRPLPHQPHGLTIPELAVWSGDTVRMDEEGFLYFIGRRDEMIKTSGYRVSPTDIEEVVYATGLVTEAAAVGVPHPVLGQAIVVVTWASDAAFEEERLLAECKRRLPSFMVPARIKRREEPLPRNPNGKIDRKLLAKELDDLFAEAAHE